MFVKAGSFEPAVRHEMRGGKGDVKIFPIVKENLPAKCRMFSEIRIDPGCSIGYHVHEGETELFCVKSGVALFTDDDKKITAYPGDALSTSSGHGHGVECVGNEPLLLTAVIVLD